MTEFGDLINALNKLKELHPNWRFGQLVENVSVWAKGPIKGATWEVTDEEWIYAAKNHIKKMSEK